LKSQNKNMTYSIRITLPYFKWKKNKAMFQDLHEGKLNKAYDKVNWNFMHKRIMLLLIFVINGDEETTTNFYHLIIVKKYFHGKDLYNIKRPLCIIDPELYEICDDKFILVKDARIKNWQLFDGYQYAFVKQHLWLYVLCALLFYFIDAVYVFQPAISTCHVLVLSPDQIKITALVYFVVGFDLLKNKMAVHLTGSILLYGSSTNLPWTTLLKITGLEFAVSDLQPDSYRDTL
ncbi:hypothetical protein ACJX0J_005824, partial [Zea mays]